MTNADRWVHPTKFTGEWPDGWNGYTFLDWHEKNKVYHPGDDYNFGSGNQDLGQDVVATSSGVIVHTSSLTTGYGKIVVEKHSLGYNLKRLIKNKYGIETDELYSFYAHLNDIKVSVGDVVDTSQIIGHVGQSGTDKAHLHFEIYAPIGELQKKPWRFYPIGWAKEKIQQYWLPAYSFIELTKQADTVADSFLGKPKEYWLQVEKDRKDLLEQVGQIETKWAIRLKEVENQLGTCTTESANKDILVKNADEAVKNQAEKFDQERLALKEEIKNREIRITELLKEQSKKYTFKEKLRLLLGL